MKTTYQTKNNAPTVTETQGSVQETAVDNGSALVDMYLELKKTSDKVNSKAIKTASVGADEALEKSYDKALKKETEPKKKGGSKVPIVLCVLMLIGIIGVVAFTMIQKNNKEKLMAEYNAIVTSVDATYSQLEAGTTVNTQNYRDALLVYEEEGVDTSEVHSKLNTIDLYLADKVKIEGLSGADVNMVSPDYQAVLDEVEGNADLNYVIPELRVLIKGMIKDAESKVIEYETLRDTMLADTNFSSATYQDTVSAIPQDIQRSELEAIMIVKNTEIAYANAVANRDALNVPVENEDVPDNKLKKAQRTAKAEAIAARDAAVAEAQVLVDEADLQRYEAYCTLYGIQDEMNGTSLLAPYKTAWEEAHKPEEEVPIEE